MTPPSNSTPESLLEERLKTFVRDHCKGVTIKLPAAWYIGIPDRLVLLPGGRAIFVELKADKGKASPAQLAWIRRLSGLGFSTRLVIGNEGLQALFKEMKGGRDFL